MKFFAGIINWVGWSIGSIIVFCISRKYGVPLIKRFISLKKLNKLESKIPKENLLGEERIFSGIIRSNQLYNTIEFSVQEIEEVNPQDIIKEFEAKV